MVKEPKSFHENFFRANQTRLVSRSSLQRAGAHARCAAVARGFRGYEREEANAEAARGSCWPRPRRAAAIREHVRVKAPKRRATQQGAADPALLPSRSPRRRAPGAGRGRIQAVAGARRRRAWSTCSNSARPTSGRTVSGGRAPVRPRPRWSERTAASPATEKGTYALCWLTGSLWPRRPRLSRLRPARAHATTGRGG